MLKATIVAGVILVGARLIRKWRLSDSSTNPSFTGNRGNLRGSNRPRSFTAAEAGTWSPFSGHEHHLR